MAKDLTVCVITYNCSQYIEKLLESIGASSIDEFDLIFIDNASTDETVGLINKDPIAKELIQLPSNMGHSYAANLALNKTKTPYLILLDHDTIVDKDLFRQLRDKAVKDKDTDFTVFAPKIIDKGREETYYGGYFHFIGKTYTGREALGEQEVGMIGSTAPLIDLEKLPESVRFDEDMFIYWNDADFFYRLRACGRKIKFVPKAIVSHLEGTEDYSHRQGEDYSSLRAYYLVRNHKMFLSKSYLLGTLLIFLPCFVLYDLMSMIFCIRKRVFIKGYLKANIDFMKILPKMISKRKLLNSERKKGDRYLVGWYPLDFNPGVISTSLESKMIGAVDVIFKAYYSMVKAVFWRERS